MRDARRAWGPWGSRSEGGGQAPTARCPAAGPGGPELFEKRSLAARVLRECFSRARSPFANGRTRSLFNRQLPGPWSPPSGAPSGQGEKSRWLLLLRQVTARAGHGARGCQPPSFSGRQGRAPPDCAYAAQHDRGQCARPSRPGARLPSSPGSRLAPSPVPAPCSA